MDLNLAACTLLDIPETDDALKLLGVARGRFDVPAIMAGLRRRRLQITGNPKNCEEDKQEIREYLKGIASQLCAFVLKESGEEKRFLKLTSFDKRIIATLVAEGGWNQKSRARLVAVAMSDGITVGGLTRILEALAEAARLGEGPLSIEKRTKHTITRQWATMPSPPTNSSFDKFVSSATERLNLDFSTQNKVLTVKMCAFFALLVLFVMFLGVALLFSGKEGKQIEIVIPNTTSSILDATEVTSSEVFRPMFTRLPSFESPELELLCLNHSDVAISIPQTMSKLATTMQESLLRGKSPSDEWLVQWEDAIENISCGWPYVSSETLVLINDQCINVIRRSEMLPEYSQLLLQSLAPPKVRLGAPLRVLKKSWCVGMLASIQCSTLLSPNARSYAASLQENSIKTCDSSVAREECLDLLTTELLSMTLFDDRTMEQWEAWMLAVSSFTKQSSAHQRYLLAIELILRSNLDLLRESNTRNVLGRLIEQSKSIRTNEFRERVLALYRDVAVTPADLWVLGNLIYSSGNSPWFGSPLIVDLDSTAETRSNTTQLLAKEWAIEELERRPSSNTLVPETIDAEQIRAWQEKYSDLRRDHGLAQYIIKARLLNEAAAYIFRGRADQVDRILNKIESYKLDAPATLSKVFLQESDGKWSAAFNRSPNEALSTLEQSGTTELGEKDAGTLARAALSMHANQVRTKATDIIISQFYNNQNVAIELLEYVGDYKSKRELAKLVANLTEAVLPVQTSSFWEKEARQAMVQHAIATSQPAQKVLDLISNELTASLLDEYLVLNPTAILPSSEITPLEAIDMLVESYEQENLVQDFQTKLFVFRPTGLLQEYLHKQLEYYFQLLKRESDSDNTDIDSFIDSLHAIVQNDSSIIDQIASIEFHIATRWDLLLSQIGVEAKESH